jgi:hypothetical protein
MLKEYIIPTRRETFHPPHLILSSDIKTILLSGKCGGKPEESQILIYDKKMNILDRVKPPIMDFS